MSLESPSSLYPQKVDLNNCDKEPIHLIGNIQDHGVLIAGDLASRKISRCSENCTLLFEKKPEDLFGLPLSDLLSAETVKQIFENLDAGNVAYIPTEINQIKLDIVAHVSEDQFIVEFEIITSRSNTLVEQMALTNLVSKLSNIQNATELNDQMAQTVKSHFGYDRVMVYQFDYQWNGKVVAEAKEEHLESWLGLNYPSTDIPVPARRLFYLELVRMIKDISSTPVPIIAAPELEAGEALNLSKSELRATSPIHVEYLNNMGVGATLTVPVLSGKTVWGLIACHHYSAKAIHYNERLACKFLTKFYANQVQINKTDDLLKTIKSSSLIRAQLINQIIESWNIPSGLSKYKYTLNSLTQSEGAAICMGDQLTLVAQCPSEDQVRAIIQRIKEITKDTIYYTNQFSNDFSGASAFKKQASGIMCVFISESRNDALLWFRPEVQETVYWAGKPQDKETKNKEVRLSPRKSFEKWKQVKDGIAMPWREHEIAVVQEFQKNVMNFVAQKYDEVKSLNIKLKKAYEDLESYSYSISHDLRAPLRGIDGFAQIIKEDYYDSLDEFGKSSIETIIASVQKMNTLIDDILAYSGIDRKRIQYRKLSISKIFEDEIATISKDYPRTQVIIETALPEVYGDSSILTLLVRNLLGNALKYSSRESQPEVRIGVQDQDTFYVRDNGIGFASKDSERIFKVFNRLQNDNFKGSGIGLSIAKRVIDNHNGEIWADSEPGKGAIFYFKLNKKNG